MDPIPAKSALKTWRIRGLEEVEFEIDKGYPRWPAHMHQDSTLDLIESGTVEYRVRNRRFLVNAGSYVWIRRYEIHEGKAIGKEPVTIRSIFLPNTLIPLNDIDDFPSVISPTCDPVLYKQLLRFHKHAETFGAAMGLAAEVCQALHLLLRSLERHNTTRITQSEHKAVEAVKEYLMAHYNEPVRILPVAKSAGLNPFYLTRVFKNLVGVTPSGYLTELRIAHARHFLAEGMPPAQVAIEVGLSDQSHLTRFFKRSTGMTPGLFRRCEV